MNEHRRGRNPGRIEIFAVAGIAEILPGDDLARLIAGAAERTEAIRPADVVVVAQKAVSKAESATVNLGSVSPGPEAVRIAAECGKDPRLVEVIMSQTRRIVRIGRGVLIVETVHGYVCANAGVDASNVPEHQVVTLLPASPAASAECLRARFEALSGAPIGVIVSDSFNRPWREGTTNVALAVAGVEPLDDLRGTSDDHGRELRSTVVSTADEMASAAQLVMGETGGALAAVIRGMDLAPAVRGLGPPGRPPERDLFR